MARIIINSDSNAPALDSLSITYLDAILGQTGADTPTWTYDNDAQTYTAVTTVPAGTSFALISDDTQGKVDLIAVEPDTAVPDPSEESDTVTAYLYTKDASGTITAGLVFTYQLIGLDTNTSGDGLDNDIHTITSDESGLVEVAMVVGGHYRYQIGNGRYRTTHITTETDDPYALPEVTG